MNKASCLSLISNAILYWNTLKINCLISPYCRLVGMLCPMGCTLRALSRMLILALNSFKKVDLRKYLYV